MPLETAGVTRADVTAFWASQPFDLRLPNNDGNTPLGNCDLCFLKGGSTILGIIRDRPELARWWAEAEAEAEVTAMRRDKPITINDAPTKRVIYEDEDSDGNIIREYAPMTEEERALWVVEKKEQQKRGARFRKDRPGYAEMLRLSRSQSDLFALDNNTQPCGCHD